MLKYFVDESAYEQFAPQNCINNHYHLTTDAYISILKKQLNVINITIIAIFCGFRLTIPTQLMILLVIFSLTKQFIEHFPEIKNDRSNCRTTTISENSS